MEARQVERRPPARPGGRTARVRADVLAAVDRLLTERGYDALSIDAIADCSGVHRTTIYRRWGSVAMLLADLLAFGIEDDWTPADTGTLEGDLIAINREVQAALADDRSTTTAVIAASFRSTEAADALGRFWADRYQRCACVVERAVTRGEVPADVDAYRLLIAATGPLYHQGVLLRRPVDRGDADAYARAALAAVHAAAPTRTSSTGTG
jgi:AcrR family transcriptional regulator